MEYYTYAYLREDGTPYYIGKGKGKRVYNCHIRQNKTNLKPKDTSRILLLKENLTEEEAFKHEIYMIAVFGRKDLGTGILRNRSDGGEGPSGAVRSKETRRKISESKKGISPSKDSKRKMSEAKKGKSPSKEHRRKLSESRKGKLPSKESLEKRSAKRSYWWKLTFMNGTEIIVHNLNKWSKENGYSMSSVAHIASGYRKRHKDIVAVVKLAQGDLKTDSFSDIILS